jgi:hypothetical protein
MMTERRKGDSFEMHTGSVSGPVQVDTLEEADK